MKQRVHVRDEDVLLRLQPRRLARDLRPPREDASIARWSPGASHDRDPVSDRRHPAQELVVAQAAAGVREVVASLAPHEVAAAVLRDDARGLEAALGVLGEPASSSSVQPSAASGSPATETPPAGRTRARRSCRGGMRRAAQRASRDASFVRSCSVVHLGGTGRADRAERATQERRSDPLPPVRARHADEAEARHAPVHPDPDEPDVLAGPRRRRRGTSADRTPGRRTTARGTPPACFASRRCRERPAGARCRGAGGVLVDVGRRADLDTGRKLGAGERVQRRSRPRSRRRPRAGDSAKPAAVRASRVGRRVFVDVSDRGTRRWFASAAASAAASAVQVPSAGPAGARPDAQVGVRVLMMTPPAQGCRRSMRPPRTRCCSRGRPGFHRTTETPSLRMAKQAAARGRPSEGARVL